MRTCRSLTVLIVLVMAEWANPLRASRPSNEIGSVVSRKEGSRAVPQAHTQRVVTLPVVVGTDIRFAHLSTAEGLSQMKVSQILQDDQGFMWFGTQYGLNRYDGYKFKVFVHDPTNAKSLSGVFVGALFRDHSGTIWVACGQSLNRFDPTTETFTQYPVPFVNQISQDSSGTLWLATGKGLYSLNPLNGRIRGYSHDPKNPRSLSSNDVKSSGEDRTGKFWAATSEGLDELDRETGEVKLHVPLHEPLREFTFYEDRLGTFWIVHASGNGLAIFDRKNRTLTPYSFYKHEPGSTAVTGARSILEDTSGNVWIGTDGAGLLKFDRDHRQFIAYRHSATDFTSLAQDSVTALLEDREGNVWASLGGMGIERFSSRPLPFTTLPYTSRPDGKGTTIVNAVYKDRAGNLWIAGREVLNRIDSTTGRHAIYRIPDVISMVEDRAGALWLGTFNHGLYRSDRNIRKFKIYRHDSADAHSLSNNVVTRMVVDRDGTLWAATWDGLNRFDSKAEQFTSYKFDAHDRNMFNLELIEGPDGMLWLGTHASGLHRFDPKTRRFSEYKKNTGQSDGLSDDRVNSVHFDRTGTMWVGTQNGLNRFDPGTGRSLTYTDHDGLTGNAIGCILEDGGGNLWMSTNNGVSRLNPATMTFTNFSTADGLPGNDLTGLGACFKDAAGEMFFGGFAGGVSFFPDRVTDTSASPVVLTDFRLLGRPVHIGSDSPLHKSIVYAEALILPYRQRMFSLEFAALSYLNPQAIRYRYKLEGLDKDWNEVGSDQRVVNFTSLPAGRYKFQVQARTARGAWSDSPRTLTVEILAPWWSTWWFRASCVTVLGFAVWAAYQFRLRHIERQFNVGLEARVNERTRIARELHDTLLQSLHGLLFQFQAARNLLPRRPDEAVQALDDAILGTEQALTESRNAIQDLRSDTLTGGHLAEMITSAGQELRGSPANTESPVFHLVEEGERQALSPASRDEIGRIALEILRNAFRHARARRIEAEIRYDEHMLRLRIRDDGTGIDPKILRVGGIAGHWGLRGVRERAQRIGAQLDFWSEAGAGTEVQLAVPATVAYETSRDTIASEPFHKVRRRAQRQ